MILGENIKISPKLGNKGLIAEIQSQYSGLLKLSGLSNDKLNLVAGAYSRLNLERRFRRNLRRYYGT